RRGTSRREDRQIRAVGRRGFARSRSLRRSMGAHGPARLAVHARLRNMEWLARRHSRVHSLISQRLRRFPEVRLPFRRADADRRTVKLTILMYHAVAVPAPGTRHLGNYVEPKHFTQQLDLLLELGYRTITFDDWLAF